MILLVKMKMSIDEAIEAFSQIVDKVYAKGLKPRQRTERLRKCMQDLLEKRGLPPDMKFEEENPNGGCFGLVISSF